MAENRLCPFHRGARWIGVMVLVTQISVFSQAQTTPAAPGKLIDLGGFRVHIECSGRGRPAVVLIHGLGDYSFDWALVQPQVASRTEACAYDRPSAAWSDPGPAPRGIVTSANELHLLLRRSHLRGPYVLVGHSWGGLIAHVYAQRFPKEVAGMVLVDSTHEDEFLWINGKVVQPRLMTNEQWAELTKPRKPIVPISSADSPKPPQAPRRARITHLSPPFDKLPPAIQTDRLWAMSQPFTKERQEGGDTLDMRQDFIAMHDIDSRAEHPLGKMPLIVLSKTPGIGDDSDYSADQLKWNRDLQDKLAALSTNSEHVIGEHSSHHIQLDDPELVIASVLRVVDAARRHKALKDEPPFSPQGH